MNAVEQALPVKIITSKPYGFWEYLKLIGKYSRLIWVFAFQEIKTSFAQTYLGLLWGVLRPLVTLVIFTLIFKYFLNVSTESPYYLFAFCGIIAWNFFYQICLNSSSAVMMNQHLIRKLYFPKIILPLSKTVVSGVEFMLSIFMVFGLILWEGNRVGLHLIALPLFILLNVFCGLAIALWMNTLNIRNRDLNQIVPSVIGFGIWITPVFYPTSLVPTKFQFLLYANPMAGVIKGYRYSFLGEPFPEWPYWIALVLVVIIAFAGAFNFARTEDKMVDYA